MYSSNHLVTVLIPVFNGEKYLSQAIKGVLNQTYTDFEFLIVDDASTDNSKNIIKSYDDSRIKLVENGWNLGQTATLNKGIKLAKGKYIARLDQDDLSLPKRLEKQVEFLNSNPDITAVGSYVICIDENGNYMRESIWPVGFENNLFNILCGIPPVGHPAVMYRKEVVEKIGYYRNDYSVSSDLDLWLRIYSKGCTCSNIPDNLTYYRIHSEQGSDIQKNLQRKNHILAFYDFYSQLTKKEIDYDKIEQYLNVLVWESEKLNKKNIENIIEIFLTLFESLKPLHNCNNNIKKLLLRSIIFSYQKILYPFQLLGLVRVLIKKNMFYIKCIY